MTSSLSSLDPALHAGLRYGASRATLGAILAVAVMAIVGGGCSLSPPPDIEDDPELAALRQEGPPPVLYRLAVAPIRLSYKSDLRPGEPLEGTAPSDAQSDQPPAYRVACDGPELQARLVKSLDWSGIFEHVEVLVPGSQHADPCDAADEAGARFLMEVTLSDGRVRYVGTAGLVWWLNLFNYFMNSPPFAWWVPDEVFAADLSAEVAVYEVRSRASIFLHTFHATHEAWLNEFMHGWMIAGWLQTPDSLSAEDWLRVYEQLYPHVVRRLEKDLIARLNASLPPQFEADAIRRLMDVGFEETARTYAVVIGASSPISPNSERDARAVDEYLVASTLPRDRTVLLGANATRKAVLDAVAGLETVSLDRVVFYYSGAGTCDPERGCSLLLGGGAEPERLAVAELAEAMRKTKSRRVLFVLDTSFGGSGGRTLAGGTAPRSEGYLAELGDPLLGWRAIVAARAGQAAYDLVSGRPEEQYGLMTYFFATPGNAPLDKDGALSVHEIVSHLGEQVPPAALSLTGFTQTPLLIGSPEGFSLPPAKVSATSVTKENR